MSLQNTILLFVRNQWVALQKPTLDMQTTPRIDKDGVRATALSIVQNLEGEQLRHDVTITTTHPGKIGEKACLYGEDASLND